MRFPDDEFEEWHEHVYKQRNKFKSLLQNIVTGVPKFGGMASPYRELTLVEIKKLAKEALE